jgi:hypothetical protein
MLQQVWAHKNGLQDGQDALVGEQPACEVSLQSYKMIRVFCETAQQPPY